MLLRPMTAHELPSWYTDELTQAFPPNECKPLADILALLEQGRYEILGLFDGPDLLGYATLMLCPTHPGYVLLDYLGITALRRNGGLGAHILSLLGQRLRGQLVLTEAEAPVPGDPEAENALRLRRIAFYCRCGFRPVYEMGTCGARFQALLLGDVPADLSPLMAAHKAIYGPHRTDVVVPLPPGEIPPTPHWMIGGQRP